MDQQPINQQPIEQPVAQEPEQLSEIPVLEIEPSPKKNKNFLVIIIAAILLLCVGTVAAYMVFFRHEEPAVVILDDTRATAEGQQFVVDSNNQFAFDFYKEIVKSENSNVFYSPYSISSALAMVYAGAKGDTASEIKSVFHYPSVEALKNNFAAIYNDINTKNDNYELKTGNALWVENTFPIIPGYVDTISDYYGGKISNLDFKNKTEESRLTINGYISEQTNNKINDLLSSGSVSNLTRLILTNAVYFKGDWAKEFNPEMTIEDIFNVSDTQTVTTDMMRTFDNDDFNYVDTGNAQILELPYKGDKLSMLIILPKVDLDSINSLLTADSLKSNISKMTKPDIKSIVIPKFKFDTKYTLNKILGSLGMLTAFNPQDADFTGIVSKDYQTKNDTNLYISSVIHQAFVEIDEQGTEAAAATAVIMDNTASVAEEPEDEINFIADHPFVFMIQDNESGNILFLGKVANPKV